MTCVARCDITAGTPHLVRHTRAAIAEGQDEVQRLIDVELLVEAFRCECVQPRDPGILLLEPFLLVWTVFQNGEGEISWAARLSEVTGNGSGVQGSNVSQVLTYAYVNGSGSLPHITV